MWELTPTCIILEGWLNIIFVGYVESVMAKPILTVRVTTRAGMSFDLSVIVIRNVVCDNPSAHRIKATLGIGQKPKEYKLVPV